MHKSPTYSTHIVLFGIVIAGLGFIGCSQSSKVHSQNRSCMMIGFFSDPPETWTQMSPGSFVIFFPEDAHAPMVGDGEIHKAVLKIKVDQ